MRLVGFWWPVTKLFLTNRSRPGKQQDVTVAIRADGLVSIKERDAIKSALMSIGTDMYTRNLYLEVWRLLEDSAKKLEEARFGFGPEEQLEIIAGLGRNFLRKGA
jgi:prefoldin subunit 5